LQEIHGVLLFERIVLRNCFATIVEDDSRNVPKRLRKTVIPENWQMWNEKKNHSFGMYSL